MPGKHYNRKFVNEIIGTLKKNGFDCIPHKNNKNKFIIGRNGGPFETYHSGESCYHPLRRWLKSNYNFDLENI